MCLNIMFLTSIKFPVLKDYTANLFSIGSWKYGIRHSVCRCLVAVNVLNIKSL